jgi:iron complex outermembrane receptor protein
MQDRPVRHRRSQRLALAAALCVAAKAGAADAGGAAEARAAARLSTMTIEELAELEVSSVSKRPERLADAAAAVYVITHEDIVRSGVLTIAEALRLAPNLQVARVDASTYAISARGSNNSSANKLLVLIDGRSVYTPLHSGVFWDTQDVLLDDIDRIEVISGPGGTLWGANAVNGVINIRTRTAQQTQGSLAGVTAGTQERAVGLRHGFTIGEDTAVRLYAKATRHDASRSPSGAELADDWLLNQLGFRSDGVRAASGWTVQGDAYDGSAHQIGSPDRKVSGANLLGRWNRDTGDGSALQVQAYFDGYSRKQPGFFTEDLDTFDLDLQHSFQWGSGHDIVWGGGLREQHDRTTGGALLAFVPPDSRLSLANVFAQDTLPLAERLKLTLGLKLERNNYTGLEVQPNIRLAWKIDDRKLLWSAISRAVRTPSRLDRDLFVFVNLGPPYNGTLDGGNNFVSERLTAYELGYRAQPSASTSFSVSAYYNDYDRLRSIEPSGPGAYVLGNQVLLRSAGIELWGNSQINERWRLNFGYTRLHERWRFAAGSADPGSPSAGGNDPRYKATLRSTFTLPRDLSLDFGLRAVAALPNPAVPSYVALDARLAWQASPDVEVSVTGFNLTDAGHVEFGGGPAASEVRRRFLLRLTCHF